MRCARLNEKRPYSVRELDTAFLLLIQFGSLSIVGVRNKYPKSAARVFTLAAFLGGAVKDPVSEAIKIAHAEAYPF